MNTENGEKSLHAEVIQLGGKAWVAVDGRERIAHLTSEHERVEVGMADSCTGDHRLVSTNLRATMLLSRKDNKNPRSPF